VSGEGVERLQRGSWVGAMEESGGLSLLDRAQPDVDGVECIVYAAGASDRKSKTK
jgi:hypothetical protein